MSNVLNLSLDEFEATTQSNSLNQNESLPLESEGLVVSEEKPIEEKSTSGLGLSLEEFEQSTKSNLNDEEQAYLDEHGGLDYFEQEQEKDEENAFFRGFAIQKSDVENWGIVLDTRYPMPSWRNKFSKPRPEGETFGKLLSAQELYGYDDPDMPLWADMGKEARRIRLLELYHNRLEEKFPELTDPDREVPVSETMGRMLGALMSPTTLIGGTKGAQGGYKMISAIAGFLGFEYGVAEGLADEGQINWKDTAIYTGMGIVTAPALLWAGRTGVARFKKYKTAKNYKLQKKSANEILDTYDHMAYEAVFNGEKAADIPTKINHILGISVKELRELEKITGRRILIPGKEHAKEYFKNLRQLRLQDEIKPGGHMDRWLGNISTRIKNMDQSIFHRLRKLEYNTKTKLNKNLTDVKPFLESLSKIKNKSLRNRITLAMYNGDAAQVETLLIGAGKKELLNSYKRVQAVLNNLHKNAKNAGLNLGYLENYFPRQIKNLDSLKKLYKFIGVEKQGRLEALINSAQKRKGSALTELERGDIVNKFLLESFPPSGQVAKLQKQRKIETLSPELLQFYSKPEDALYNYIRRVVTETEKVTFFGKFWRKNKLSSGTDIDSSVGFLVDDSFQKGSISQTQVDELAEILQARFINGEKSPHWAMRMFKSLTYAATLGNPRAAATQLGDTYLAAYKAGNLLNTFKTTLTQVIIPGRRNTLRISDYGLIDISEEFTTEGMSKTHWFMRQAFKWSGFRGVDRIGKETILNQGFKKYMKEVGNPTTLAAFKKKWLPSFGDDLPDLINDLKAGNMDSERVRLLLWHELSDMQPISLSEMPQKYLEHPNGRTFYMLKTFTLKQFDVMRRDGFQLLANKGTRIEGAKNLLRYATYFIAGGMTSANVKKWLKGEVMDDDDWSDAFINNAWKLGGWNKYGADKFSDAAKSGDIVKGIYEAGKGILGVPVSPWLSMGRTALSFVDNTWLGGDEDIDYRGIKSVPPFGQQVERFLLGGKEAEEQRERDEKKKDFKKTQKTKDNFLDRLQNTLGFAKGGTVPQMQRLGFAAGKKKEHRLGLADGGEVSKHPRKLANKKRDVNELLNKNSAVPFVDRINNPQSYPTPERNADDSISTHLLSAELDEDGVAWAFPNKIFNKENNTYTTYDNNFEALDIAKERGNAIRFKTIGDANFFSQNYKNEDFEKYYQSAEPEKEQTQYALDKAAAIEEYEDTANAYVEAEDEYVPIVRDPAKEFSWYVPNENYMFSRENISKWVKPKVAAKIEQELQGKGIEEKDYSFLQQTMNDLAVGGVRAITNFWQNNDERQIKMWMAELDKVKDISNPDPELQAKITNIERKIGTVFNAQIDAIVTGAQLEFMIPERHSSVTEQLQNIMEAGGLGEALWLTVVNPKATASVVFESLSQYAPTLTEMAITRSFFAKYLKGWQASVATSPVIGRGSYIIEYYNVIREQLTESGVDLKDREAIRLQFADEEWHEKTKEIAKQRGIPIMIFDMISLSLAGHIYSGIVKRAVNKGSNVNAAQAVSLALEAGVQAIGGGGGEAMAQYNVHDELTERYGLSEWRWGDIALEAVSEVAIAIPAAVINKVTSGSPLKAEMMLLNRQIKAIKSNTDTKNNYVVSLLKPHQNYDELDSYRSRREEIDITPESEPMPLLEDTTKYQSMLYDYHTKNIYIEGTPIDSVKLLYNPDDKKAKKFPRPFINEKFAGLTFQQFRKLFPDEPYEIGVIPATSFDIKNGTYGTVTLNYAQEPREKKAVPQIFRGPHIRRSEAVYGGSNNSRDYGVFKTDDKLDKDGKPRTSLLSAVAGKYKTWRPKPVLEEYEEYLKTDEGKKVLEGREKKWQTQEFSGLPEKRISSEEAVEQASKIPLFLKIVREGKLEQVKEIFTPEGNMAWGSYRDNIIQFVENPQETTLPHETFHAFIDLFAEEKRKQAAYNAVKLRKGNKDLSDAQVEEILSEEFASWFIEDNKPKGVIERFFAYIKKLMQTFAKDGKINKLFKDVMSPHLGEISIDIKLSPDVVTKYQGRKDVPETEKQKKVNESKRNLRESYDYLIVSPGGYRYNLPTLLIEAVNPQKAYEKKHWLSLIKNWRDKGLLKKEELDESKLGGWLESQSENSKFKTEELLEFMKENTPLINVLSTPIGKDSGWLGQQPLIIEQTDIQSNLHDIDLLQKSRTKHINDWTSWLAFKANQKKINAAQGSKDKGVPNRHTNAKHQLDAIQFNKKQVNEIYEANKFVEKIVFGTSDVFDFNKQAGAPVDVALKLKKQVIDSDAFIKYLFWQVADTHQAALEIEEKNTPTGTPYPAPPADIILDEFIIDNTKGNIHTVSSDKPISLLSYWDLDATAHAYLNDDLKELHQLRDRTYRAKHRFLFDEIFLNAKQVGSHSIAKFFLTTEDRKLIRDTYKATLSGKAETRDFNAFALITEKTMKEKNPFADMFLKKDKDGVFLILKDFDKFAKELRTKFKPQLTAAFQNTERMVNAYDATTNPGLETKAAIRNSRNNMLLSAILENINKSKESDKIQSNLDKLNKGLKYWKPAFEQWSQYNNEINDMVRVWRGVEKSVQFPIINKSALQALEKQAQAKGGTGGLTHSTWTGQSLGNLGRPYTILTQTIPGGPEALTAGDIKSDSKAFRKETSDAMKDIEDIHDTIRYFIGKNPASNQLVNKVISAKGLETNFGIGRLLFEDTRVKKHIEDSIEPVLQFYAGVLTLDEAENKMKKNVGQFAPTEFLHILARDENYIALPSNVPKPKAVGYPKGMLNEEKFYEIFFEEDFMAAKTGKYKMRKMDADERRTKIHKFIEASLRENFSMIRDIKRDFEKQTGVDFRKKEEHLANIATDTYLEPHYTGKFGSGPIKQGLATYNIMGHGRGDAIDMFRIREAPANLDEQEYYDNLYALEDSIPTKRKKSEVVKGQPTTGYVVEFGEDVTLSGGLAFKGEAQSAAHQAARDRVTKELVEAKRWQLDTIIGQQNYIKSHIEDIKDLKKSGLRTRYAENSLKNSQQRLKAAKEKYKRLSSYTGYSKTGSGGEIYRLGMRAADLNKKIEDIARFLYNDDTDSYTVPDDQTYLNSQRIMAHIFETPEKEFAEALSDPIGTSLDKIFDSPAGQIDPQGTSILKRIHHIRKFLIDEYEQQWQKWEKEYHKKHGKDAEPLRKVNRGNPVTDLLKHDAVYKNMQDIFNVRLLDSKHFGDNFLIKILPKMESMAKEARWKLGNDWKLASKYDRRDITAYANLLISIYKTHDHLEDLKRAKATTKDEFGRPSAEKEFKEESITKAEEYRKILFDTTEDELTVDFDFAFKDNPEAKSAKKYVYTDDNELHPLLDNDITNLKPLLKLIKKYKTEIDGTMSIHAASQLWKAAEWNTRYSGSDLLGSKELWNEWKDDADQTAMIDDVEDFLNNIFFRDSIIGQIPEITKNLQNERNKTEDEVKNIKARIENLLQMKTSITSISATAKTPNKISTEILEKIKREAYPESLTHKNTWGKLDMKTTLQGYIRNNVKGIVIPIEEKSIQDVEGWAGGTHKVLKAILERNMYYSPAAYIEILGRYDEKVNELFFINKDSDDRFTRRLKTVARNAHEAFEPPYAGDKGIKKHMAQDGPFTLELLETLNIQPDATALGTGGKGWDTFIKHFETFLTDETHKILDGEPIRIDKAIRSLLNKKAELLKEIDEVYASRDKDGNIEYESDGAIIEGNNPNHTKNTLVKFVEDNFRELVIVIWGQTKFLKVLDNRTEKNVLDELAGEDANTQRDAETNQHFVIVLPITETMKNGLKEGRNPFGKIDEKGEVIWQAYKKGGLVTKKTYRRGGLVSRNGYRKNMSRLGFQEGRYAQ